MNSLIRRAMPLSYPGFRYMSRNFKVSDKDAIVFPFGLGKVNKVVLTAQNGPFNKAHQVVLVMSQEEYHSQVKRLNDHGISSGESLLKVIQKLPFSDLIRIINTSKSIN